MVHLYGTACAAPPTSPSEPSNTPTAGPGGRGLLPGHCSRADGHHEAAADDHPAPPAVRRRHPTVSPLPLSHDRSGKLDWILLLALVRVQRCSAPSWCHRSVCPRSAPGLVSESSTEGLRWSRSHASCSAGWSRVEPSQTGTGQEAGFILGAAL